MLASLDIIDWLSSVSGRAMLVAVVANLVCALVGMMLVVRRQSLMGDAISHAVLPGLAVAFLVSGSMGSGVMLLGALAAGLLTTFLTETLRQRGGVSADAALGVVYTSLFALGVLIVKRFLKGVHFDVACVYEGSLLHAALDTTTLATPLVTLEIPTALIASGAVLLGIGVVNLLLWKELRLCAFDPALATTMGFSSTLMHYVVMALVAVTAAVAFEAVGAILVVAMMIAPAAAAQLLADRLAPMTTIAALLAMLYGVVGYMLAEQWDVSPSGMMATLAGIGYVAAALGSPRHGVLARWWSSIRMAWQVRRDDLLSLLYRSEERQAPAPERNELLRAIGGGRAARRALLQLASKRRVTLVGGRVQLTDSGRSAAAKLVRSHRLWETYLVDRVGIKEDHVHEPAHLVEHYLDPELEAELRSTLTNPKQDPHGRAIPSDDQTE